MNDIRIESQDAHPSEGCALVDEGLGRSNDAAAPLHEVRPLSSLALDASGKVIGGAVGRRWGLCCELQQLWVDPAHRRQGLARRLVEAFEQRARTQGCTHCLLETFSFQAPAFYRGLDYRVVYENSLYPHGITKAHLVKALVTPASPPLLPPAWETSRLHLRHPRPSDARPIFERYGQDAQVAHFMIWRPPTRLEQTQTFIDGCIADLTQERRRAYVLAHRGQDEPIGMLDLRFDAHAVDIGYVLARSEWGQGLMPEAIRSAVERLMADPRIHRIQATCDVDNRASQRTLEKSGFVCEGRLARHTVHPALSPLPRDVWLYARCREGG